MMLDNIKIGDRLKLRDDLIEGQQYGNLTLWPPMYDLRGEVFTVKAIRTYNKIVDVEENAYGWSFEMFEEDDSKPVSLLSYLL